MNCRFNPIDACNFTSMRALLTIDRLIRMALWNDVNVALHHCPGEGPGESP
jgi:hypothetical protein